MAEEASEDHAAGPPMLSVVVPIYNTEKYLHECLESIGAQEVADFEVIMVDDGSTDRSGEIAARWAQRDSRYRLMRQDNHGLGHARNTGADYARGRYLAFLDSDDVASKHAYRIMIETLDKTGSDFATGNIHRFDSSGHSWQSPYFRGIAKTERLATHVSQYRELLRDHLAPNKVWRTSFWQEVGIRFPVGVLYEDVPTIIPMHVRARAVDVVPVVATLWRRRDQGDTSITQKRRQNPQHVRDRCAAVLANSRYIAKHANKDLKDDYDRHVLLRELRVYLDLYVEVDDAYRTELVSSLGRYIAQVTPEALRQVPVDLRIAYALLERGALEDLEKFIKLRRANQVRDLPVVIRNGRALVDFALPHKTQLSDEICDLTDELGVASKVSDVGLTGRDLVIRGWAYISRLPIEAAGQHEIEVWLEGGGKKILAEITYCRDERAAVDAGAAQEASGRVGFSARIPRRLLKQWPWRRKARTWAVMVAVTNGGITCTGQLTKPVIGKAERPVMARLRSDQWLRVCWKDEGLTCRVRTEAAILTDVRVDDGTFDITLRTSSPIQNDAGVRVQRSDSKDAYSYRVTRDPRDKRLAHVRISGTELLGSLGGGDNDASTVAWDMFFRPSQSVRWQAVLDANGLAAHAITVGETGLLLRRSRAATLRFVRGVVAPVLTGAEWRWDGATLAVSMKYRGSVPIRAVALSGRPQAEHLTFPVTVTDDELTAELPVGTMPRFGETASIRAGTWDLSVRTDAGYVPVTIGPGMLDALPSTVESGQRQYSLIDRLRSYVSLVVDSDLSWGERGGVNQRRLRTDVYPRLKTQVREAVLYEAYFGQQFSDSPRELFRELRRRELDVEHLVVVRDQQFQVPEGATAVPYRSERYFEALAQSRYVISNTHLLGCFERAPGQVVLQTWHGIGTKKIGLDLDTVHFANRSYIDRLKDGESDSWDYLISPNPFTSPILRRAFAFTGALLETGVPRNDLFYRPDRKELARRIRERLGVTQDRKIVLYAPTWRDHLHDGPGRYRLDLRFDLNEAARKLGDEYVVVFRKHSNVSDRLPPGVGSVIDASDYPDVQELLLVADVLISDYSTLMCDFANTGRPMLFYTYDLANYRDVLRGFYFDFENEVPGPLITAEGDLVPAILDAEKIHTEYNAKYTKFADRFCPWDDGMAASRVVDAVFGKCG